MFQWVVDCTEDGSEGGHSGKMVGHCHNGESVLPPVVDQSLNHRLATARFQSHVRSHHPVAVDDRDCVATNRGPPLRLSPAHLETEHVRIFTLFRSHLVRDSPNPIS